MSEMEKAGESIPEKMETLEDLARLLWFAGKGVLPYIACPDWGRRDDGHFGSCQKCKACLARPRLDDALGGWGWFTETERSQTISCISTADLQTGMVARLVEENKRLTEENERLGSERYTRRGICLSVYQIVEAYKKWVNVKNAWLASPGSIEKQAIKDAESAFWEDLKLVTVDPFGYVKNAKLLDSKPLEDTAP